MKTVLVLGGGFGGLAAAHELRRRLSHEHRIVLIERRSSFSMGLSNLWVMTGEREHPSQGKRELSALRDKGIEYVNEEILLIFPAEKKVQTSSQLLKGDYIIISLGAELAPQEIDGFQESAYNLYDDAEAFKLQAALRQFRKGRVVILVSRTPFKCPAAPYEAAFLIDDLLRKRGVRSQAEVEVHTPEPYPMPSAGQQVGDALRKMLQERDIAYFPDQNVLKIESSSKTILFELEDARFDLLVGVPPHTAPNVIREAGLVGSTGWIPVDPATLQTRYPGVYAIGDINFIALPNGMPLPKAGVFAEAEATIVAENIAAEVRGEVGSAKFTGEGYCYIDVGGGMAALGSGNFYASPAPHVELKPPSKQFRKEKEEFERSRLDKWL